MLYSLSYSECLFISEKFASFNVYFSSGNYPDPIEPVGIVNVIISCDGNTSSSDLLSSSISENDKTNLIECAVGHCRQRYFFVTKKS